jgi:lipid-A-disaccharide synthase
MRLLAVAGEYSGDTHGGALLRGLAQHLPGLEVSGIGGPAMTAAGLTPLYPFSALQVHGLVEVLRHLPRLYRLLWSLERRLREHAPDALLLIDYPGFNLKLARAAKRLGIPVLFYSSPQVWAWRRGRIAQIAAAVDKLFVLFPFEVPLYEAAGVDVEFHGHPLVERQADAAAVAAVRAALPPDDGIPLIALMPGSRGSELRRNLPGILAGVALAQAQGLRARYVLPLAEGLDQAAAEAMIARSGLAATLLPGAFLPVLQLADLAVVASGTATLQVAMAGIPFIVVYRVSPLTYALARRMAYVQHLSIVNIMAGREIVPELVQEAFTPQRLGRTLLALAGDPARQAQMREALADTTGRLGAPGAYERTAAAMAAYLRQRPARQATG